MKEVQLNRAQVSMVEGIHQWNESKMRNAPAKGSWGNEVYSPIEQGDVIRDICFFGKVL